MKNYKSFGLFAKGASHLKDNKPCQDYAASKDFEDYSIAIVSDGHGGNKYFRSARGSEFAIKIALENVKIALNESDFKRFNNNIIDVSADKDRDKLLLHLEESIIKDWREIVKTDFKKELFTEKELEIFNNDLEFKNSLSNINPEDCDECVKAYGATLIVAVICKDFWFGFQIGDGTFVLKQDGEYKLPIELDELCMGPKTTSLCNNTAINYFHHAWGSGSPEAIFVATDGVDQSFAEMQSLYKFYDSIIANVKGNFKASLKELGEYLPKLSEKGSRDDVSVGGIIRGK